MEIKRIAYSGILRQKQDVAVAVRKAIQLVSGKSGILVNGIVRYEDCRLWIFEKRTLAKTMIVVQEKLTKDLLAYFDGEIFRDYKKNEEVEFI